MIVQNMSSLERAGGKGLFLNKRVAGSLFKIGGFILILNLIISSYLILHSIFIYKINTVAYSNHTESRNYT